MIMDVIALVLERIEQIKEHYGEHPNCYLVAIFLSTCFNGTIYYDSSHCITEIEGEFFDKRGLIPIEEVEKGRYIPIYEYGHTEIESEVALMQSLIEKHK